MVELLNLNLYHFLMIFLRLGSALMLIPGFSTSYVSMQFRLSIALVLTTILMPIITPGIPSAPDSFSGYIIYMLSEITIGIFLAVIMQIIYAALSLAGNFAGQAIGLSNAQIFDPTSQNQSIIVETFLSVAALTIIFITDLHHTMLNAIIESYQLFPINSPLPLNDFADQMAQTLNQTFIIGFKIGSPFIAFTIIFYTGMGLVSRLMPQLNIFFLSLPLQIYLGFGLLMITLPVMLMWFIKYFEDGLQLYLS